MKARMIVSALLVVICFGPTAAAVWPRANEKVPSHTAENLDRTIKLEIVVNAASERVWRSWTTRNGIKSFFAPDCDIDLRVLGKYDIWFAPSAPIGLRGAEGNLVLAIQEGKMLSFTWDAPPTFPNIRKQRTSVVVRFVPVAPNKTRVVLTQSGWGEGEEWQQAHDYFIKAWGEAVLPLLKHSLEVGPIDWKNLPQQLEKAVLTTGGGGQ